MTRPLAAVRDVVRVPVALSRPRSSGGGPAACAEESAARTDPAPRAAVRPPSSSRRRERGDGRAVMPRSLSSRSESTMSLRVRPHRAQEVDLPEVGPECLTEVELAVGTLPEQESRQPLLPRGPDDEVRIGLTAGVEALGDVLDVEDLRALLDRAALLGLLVQERADGAGDL